MKKLVLIVTKDIALCLLNNANKLKILKIVINMLQIYLKISVSSVNQTFISLIPKLAFKDQSPWMKFPIVNF